MIFCTNEGRSYLNLFIRDIFHAFLQPTKLYHCRDIIYLMIDHMQIFFFTVFYVCSQYFCIYNQLTISSRLHVYCLFT